MSERPGDLLAALPAPAGRVEALAPGAVLLRGFAAARIEALVDEIGRISSEARFRNMTTPGGFRMSVAMTNCGSYGWVTDRSGYRYAPRDPDNERPWPAMPASFRTLARDAAGHAGFPAFAPDSCLINRYEPKARLSLHQDKDERDYSAPIVSVSIGMPAIFSFGGARRRDPVTRHRLESGDVVVWGGPSRLFHHGVDRIVDAPTPLTGRCRYNLTFRDAMGTSRAAERRIVRA